MPALLCVEWSVVETRKRWSFRGNDSVTYHDYVDFPELAFGFFKQPGNMLLVRDVGLDGDCLYAMLLADLLRNFLGSCCRGDVVDNHIYAVRSQTEGNRRANAATRPGDWQRVSACFAMREQG